MGTSTKRQKQLAEKRARKLAWYAASQKSGQPTSKYSRKVALRRNGEYLPTSVFVQNREGEEYHD